MSYLYNKLYISNIFFLRFPKVELLNFQPILNIYKYKSNLVYYSNTLNKN